MRTDLDLALLEQVSAESLAHFDCGESDLNDFLRNDAQRLQQENVARTYLAIAKDSGQLLGYCTLLSDSLHLLTRERKSLGLATEDHPIIPATKIARLGVSVEAQRTGAGKFMVKAAFAIAREVADLSGCRLLTVDAYPDALSFYEKLGFIRNRSPNYRGRENPSLRLDLFGRQMPDWL